MAHVETVSIGVDLAGTAGRQIPVPPGAIALVGLTWLGTGDFTRHVDVTAESDFSRIAHFIAFRGRKSSHGCFPVRDNSPLLIGVDVFSTADDALLYTLLAHFLMPDTGDKDTVLPMVPFRALGGDDVVVDLTATSAANTAQTVDISPDNDQDAIEVLTACFYNSGAGTSTGEMDFFDGTTAVTIDSTAAVAEYTFNMNAKGNPHVMQSVASGNVARFVIGAGGAAITTTLIVVYRAYPVH